MTVIILSGFIVGCFIGSAAHTLRTYFRTCKKVRVLRDEIAKGPASLPTAFVLLKLDNLERSL